MEVPGYRDCLESQVQRATRDLPDSLDTRDQTESRETLACQDQRDLEVTEDLPAPRGRLGSLDLQARGVLRERWETRELLASRETLESPEGVARE